ncbi:MAG: hypothetical protein ACR650_03760 [Methylocystis sp.]|jgi:HEAT repeat protein
MPTIEECQQLRDPLRGQLELLDYDVRNAIARGLSDIEANGKDDVLFMNASVTVLLSIAARIFHKATEPEDAQASVQSFVHGAQDAIDWAKTRRLRYNVAGEG